MKPRRALGLFALLLLVAMCQSQCGCVWLDRAVPPLTPPAQHNAAIQGQFLWAILFGLVGVGVGVFLLIELPFKKTGLAVAGGSAAMIGCALYFSWVADHIGWFVLGASAIGAVVLLWGKVRLKNAARAARNAIPPGVVISSAAQSLLNKL